MLYIKILNLGAVLGCFEVLGEMEKWGKERFLNVTILMEGEIVNGGYFGEA